MRTKYAMIDTFAHRLKEALDQAHTHGDIPTYNFYTYKQIDTSTGQPPQLQLPYVAIDIPAGGAVDVHRQKPNVWQQPVIKRTRIAIQIGGRMLVEVPNGDNTGSMLGGFDADVLPLITVVEDFIERNPSLTAPATQADFANEQIGVMFDQPSETPFRVKDHEGHIYYVLLEYMTRTKED